MLVKMSGETDIALWVYGMGYMGWHTTLWGFWRKHATFLASGKKKKKKKSFWLLEKTCRTFGFQRKYATFLASGVNIQRFWLLENTYHAFGFWRNHTTLMVSGVNIPHFCLPEKTCDLSTSEENILRFGLVENIPGF